MIARLAGATIDDCLRDNRHNARIIAGAHQLNLLANSFWRMLSTELAGFVTIGGVMAPQSSLHSAEQQTAFYRLYVLQADDHIARRREDYFANDAAAISAAKHVIDDFHGVGSLSVPWPERVRERKRAEAEVSRTVIGGPRSGRTREIWCGPRKVITLSREAMAQLQPPHAGRTVPRADSLIRRNHVLLAEARVARSRTAAIAVTAAKAQRPRWVGA